MTMMTTRMTISARMPRKGHSGARWLRTRRMVVTDTEPTWLVALHWYSPGSSLICRFVMLSSV